MQPFLNFTPPVTLSFPSSIPTARPFPGLSQARPPPFYQPPRPQAPIHHNQQHQHHHQIIQQENGLEFKSSFNVVSGLNILFVDLDQTLNRPMGNNTIHRFFQSDTILWEFIREYISLIGGRERIDLFNIENVLRYNQMGYTHIVVDGRRWEDLTVDQQADCIEIFKRNVRQIKPYVIMVIGRKTYNSIVRGSYPCIRGKMNTGFQKFSIPWKSNSTSKGSSKVFLMRKTPFRDAEERARTGIKLRKTYNLLSEFKKMYGMHTIHPPAHPRSNAVNRRNKRTLSEFLEDVIDDKRRQKRRLERNQGVNIYPPIPNSDESSESESDEN